MRKQSILNIAFNLGMTIIKSDNGEIVIKTGLQYNDNGLAEEIKEKPVIKRYFKLIRGEKQ